MAQRLIDEVFDALDEQTVVVPPPWPAPSPLSTNSDKPWKHRSGNCWKLTLFPRS